MRLASKFVRVVLGIKFIFVFGATAQTLQVRPLIDEVVKSGRPFVLNGRPSNPADYPVTFLSGALPKEMCTWFLAGGRVLLGAAHCLHGEHGETYAQIEFKSHGQTYTGVCEASAGWPKDMSQDWAACRISPAYVIETSPDIPVSGFEVIASAAVVLDQQKIEIGGFGCTTPGGPLSIDYNVGIARVSGVPPEVHVSGTVGGTPNAIAFRRAPALTCAGDSGGPAYFYQKSGRVFRVVVGVNSSVVQDAGVGYLASASTEANRQFLRKWSASVGEPICGIDPAAKGCRPFLK